MNNIQNYGMINYQVSFQGGLKPSGKNIRNICESYSRTMLYGERQAHVHKEKSLVEKIWSRLLNVFQ